MGRHLIALSFLVMGALAACSSGSTTAPSSAAPTATSASPDTASAAPSEAMTPSRSPEPVAGGTATDFCGAFDELQAVSDVPSDDAVAFGTLLRAAAADMRTFAPAEIEKAAHTYADVMDAIGTAALGGAVDQASLGKTMTDAMTESAADIAITTAWVAAHCSS